MNIQGEYIVLKRRRVGFVSGNGDCGVRGLRGERSPNKTIKQDWKAVQRCSCTTGLLANWNKYKI